MKRFLRFALSFVAIATMASVAVTSSSAAEDPPEPTWFVDESKLPFDPLPGFEDSERYWGIHLGAGFRVEVPADWNGDLVMWAHGFRGDGLELTVDNGPLRAYLLANGYAWGASSYTENGYNVVSGVNSTAQLVYKIRRRYLPELPENTYLVGASMGGHITALSIERFPGIYDGAMPICGVVGDYHLFDFFLDFNLVMQQLALGESAYPVDPGTYVTTTADEMKAALELAPGSWPFALNDEGEGLKQFTELATGGVRPNFDEAWSFWNSIPTATGAPFLVELGVGDGTLPNSEGMSVLNNDLRLYQLDLDGAISAEEAELNSDIFRTTVDYRARRNERILGNISVPVLSMHNLGDLFVPFMMEQRYALDVMEAGKSDLLVQRAIRGVGHCDFTPYELVNGFDDLVSWVVDGVKPDGDDVLDPEIVGSEDYGCRFSDPDHTLHTFATPCTDVAG